jgi:hypothetical protein
MSPEPYRRVSILRRIFFLQLVAGIGMVFLGLFIVPSLPYLLLDVVLNPTELQDDTKLNDTLSLLQRHVPLDMISWIAAGVFLIGTSFAGRRLTRPMADATEREK